jgi:hypothetical protein
MSKPSSLFEALQDGWDDAALREVPTCRCGQTLEFFEYRRGECETCQGRLRIPCLERDVMRPKRRP